MTNERSVPSKPEKTKPEQPIDGKAISTFEKENLSVDSDVESSHEAIRREKGEPAEGMEPLPVKLVLGLFVLLMWGGWYLGKYDAGFAVNRIDGPMAFIGEGGPAKSEPAKLDPLVVGKRIYNSCMSCHQPDGNGKGAFPPLNKSEWIDDPPEVFAAILLSGIKGPLEVNGKMYNAEMPAWGRQLNDFEIAAVMSYVRSNWDNSASAVSEELVANVRSKQARSRAWSMEELLQLRQSMEAESSATEPIAPATEEAEETTEQAEEPVDPAKAAA